ncbi:hypothetical protein OIU78_000663 [Salix suchowensis]|nr:hypothetical protein OIU78_000663 [Salix suchowensis]
MALLRRTFPSSISKPLKNPIHPRLCISWFEVARFLHDGSKTESNTVVSSICDSLRRGYNWDTLNRKFESLQLNNLLVKNVLLELKEPNDAKRALGFFHWSARRNFVHGVQSYCMMIHILVQARLIMDAQALLESILKKSVGDPAKFVVVDSLLSSYKIIISNPLVFDLLVQAYAKLRMFDIGFDVCCRLEEHGFTLSLISFNTLIHVVQKSDKSSLTWKIYEHMLHRRTYPNEATIESMINALCKEGKLQTIVNMLDKIHGKRCPPVVIVNTCLVFRILEEGRVEPGLALLKMMLRKNTILDTVAYSLIVYAKVKLGNLNSAMQVYEEMLKRGFNANSFVYTSFIGAYCKEGKIEEANRLLQEMENMGLKPYGDTFNLLLEGCAKAGRVEETLTYCKKMMGMGLVPSLSAFNEMIGKLCKMEDVAQANEMLTKLLDEGFLADEITYSNLISGYAKNNQIQEMLKLYYEMEYRSLCPGLTGFTSLIKGLCHCGKLEEAEKYLRTMIGRSLNPCEDVYEALIKGYFEKGDRRKALNLYNGLVSKGLKLCCSHYFGASTENMEGF